MQIEGGALATIALVLHELATNAVKYGALSVPDGWVEVVWHFDGEAKRLEWRERGDPPAVAPTRTGFGSIKIATLAKTSDGRSLVYGPEGLVCRLSL